MGKIITCAGRRVQIANNADFGKIHKIPGTEETSETSNSQILGSLEINDTNNSEKSGGETGSYSRESRPWRQK
ncbi:hypothetical protein AKJ37_05270 [candidate division MSBL1 archaeon SCGC-AAA259I09]|uniref:Uncharacterized protein n=1 Tax=candidate division MSBL1 archaeon SCGC-AAA259I09 TaxID=1698267 RepID=A0A133UQK8_9EURY|nr:hypothetical protein AKJ37_05270 [candidate division MSBL1 archaeon SCGC-AAA259I09]